MNKNLLVIISQSSETHLPARGPGALQRESRVAGDEDSLGARHTHAPTPKRATALSVMPPPPSALPPRFMCSHTPASPFSREWWLLNAVHVVLSMRQRRWVRRPLMCWRPPTAAARWRRSSIHLRARSNAPEMNFLCARAAVQRVAAADALCERHPTMTMECMYFAPHTWPARPHHCAHSLCGGLLRK